jgi:hypothetical protein
MPGEFRQNTDQEPTAQPEVSREALFTKLEDMIAGEWSVVEIIEEAAQLEPAPDPADEEAVMAYAEKMAYLRDLMQGQIDRADLLIELSNWAQGRQGGERSPSPDESNFGQLRLVN